MLSLAFLLPGIVGACVGALGWLFVGLYIQRRQFIRQARNGARAVYFEIDMNRVRVDVTREFGSFTPLSRSSFERLLPELATWLGPGQLQTIVTAYMAHAGYEQASADSEFPPELRRQALTGILESQEEALQLLRSQVFSPRQARELAQKHLTTTHQPEIKTNDQRAAIRKRR